MQKITLTLFAVITLSGCSTYGGYSPIVDTYNDKYSGYLDRDQAECRNLAEQASGGAAKQTAVGAGTGAVLGAIGGVVAGAFTGNPGTGAAIGAASGGLLGGGYQGHTSDERFRRAYQTCLENRGHRVLR